MEPSRLIEGYQSIMQTIYSPREYYQRVRDSLKRTPHGAGDAKNYDFIHSVTAFARIAVKLGVLDRERKEFWRFFGHALAKHRDRFAESLRLAAMGYHFRKLSDTYNEA